MEYTNLGSTGTRVSRICLGCMTYGSKKWREWVLDEEQGRPFIQRALELGFNFFDTADMYSLGRSEEVLGRALKDFGPSRDKLVIATKVFFPMGDDPNQKGLSRKHIMHAIDDSLRRLGTDYVDLYQIHRFDYDTRIEETLEALHDVVKAGKARYIGASSMFAWQFARMLYTSDRHHWTALSPCRTITTWSIAKKSGRWFRCVWKKELACCRGVRWRGECWQAIAKQVLSVLNRTTTRRSFIRAKPTTVWWIAFKNWLKIKAYRRRRLRWRGCFTSPE